MRACVRACVCVYFVFPFSLFLFQYIEAAMYTGYTDQYIEAAMYTGYTDQYIEAATYWSNALKLQGIPYTKIHRDLRYWLHRISSQERRHQQANNGDLQCTYTYSLITSHYNVCRYVHVHALYSIPTMVALGLIRGRVLLFLEEVHVGRPIPFSKLLPFLAVRMDRNRLLRLLWDGTPSIV